MLANATRLCDATFGLLLLYEGDWRFRVVAMSNVAPAPAELRQREPIFEVNPQTGLGRAVATKDVVHIADYAEEAIYKERHPAAVALGDLGGARTYLVVPLLKDKEIAGAIAIYRQEVRPFADKQVELVQNFAAQAVIAIENTRLLGELREALENQTTSADILRTIASSPASAERALHVIAETTARRFGASNVNIRLLDGDAYFASSAQLGRWLRTCKRCFPKALSMQTSVPAKRFWNGVRFTFTPALKRCEFRIEPRASSRV